MKATLPIPFVLFGLCSIFAGGLQAAEEVNFFGLYGICRNTPEETWEYVRNCKEAGITVLIPSVSGGGGAIWKTATEYYYPPLKQVLDSGYDALAELIKVAHENGIKVMPSVAVGAMNKLAREHPEWVTLDRNGEPSTKTGPTSVAFSYPGARAWKVQGIMDLVTGYDVDGVVLDYCRYPEHTTTQETSYGFYGYDGPLVSVCEQTYGFNPKTEPINSPNWNIFNRLRKESVTAFVAELREAIRQSGRNVTLIGFGDTDPEMDANMAGRDSAEWARRGLIDAYLAGTYLDPVDKMGETVESIRKAIGPNTKVYTAITPYGDRVTTEAEMLAMAKVQLAAGTDGLWIYRDDFFEKHNLWKAAATTTEVLTVATAQGVAWKGSAAPLISYDAAAAGVGVTPTAVTPEWTFSGGGYPEMVNNGTFLLQSGSPGTYGEYSSPSAGAGTMVFQSSTYGIGFRVRPLTDVQFVGSDWPNLYLGWADNTFFYNVTIDKYSGGTSSGTGDIVYGKGSFSPAITGIDWSVPHDIYIGVRGPAGQYGEFDFYLDGVFKGTVSGGSIARDRAGWEFLENKVIFGDGTTGGTDVQAQWYSIGIYDSAVPPPSGLSYTPDSQTGTVGAPIISMIPSVAESVTNYSVSPALPSGLGIDAATGIISGTPTAVSVAATYTVAASTSRGDITAQVTIGVRSASIPLVSYDAAAAGVGVTPTAVTPEWTFSGGGYPEMVNNGTFLLQSGSPGTYGEYASPSAGAGTMVYRSSTYGIAFRVEPLTDVPFVASDWPNLYVGWADDTYFYNVTIDKYSGGTSSGTGDIVYGKGSFSPAITGIDWSVPHDIYIGVRGPAGEYGEFDFYLDGVLQSTVSGGSIARDRAGWEFLENKVIFGDGTTGGTDVEAQWYSIGIYGTAAPVPPAPSGLSYTPVSQTGSVGTAIVGMTPTVTGIVTNYSVSPALPPGLGIDAATGVISGTPTAVSAAGTYTVTASNTGGSTAAEVAIGVQSGSYAAWAQGAPLNAANQLKYAIGGASSPTATNGVAPVTTVNSSLLSITAIVRTDDPSLTVYGQSILNLASGTWITNDVSMNPSVDQAGVPAGTQRQIFSTPRATNDVKKFLRLKTILQPQGNFQ